MCIKPANIFLNKTFEDNMDTIHAFVADLGLSCSNDNDPFKNDNAGSPLYMPPDIIEDPGFANFAMNVWAVVVTTQDFFLWAA